MHLRRQSLQFVFALTTFVVSAFSFAYAEPTASDAWTTKEESAEKAFIDGKYENADKLWKDALAEAEKFGTDDLKVAQTLNQMTHLFIKQGRYEEALPSLNRALTIRRKKLGEANILTAETLGNLALVDEKLGKDEDAEKLYKEVLEIKEKKLGDNSPSVAITKTNLANLYAEMRNCSEAKTLYLQALAIDEKSYGSTHEEVASDLINLGSLLYHCNDAAGAIEFLQRAAKISDKNPALKASAFHYVGLCHAKLQHPSDAEEAYKQALAAQEAIKGKGHPDTIVHLLNIAKVADEQGRTDEAEKIYNDALDTLQKNTTTKPMTLTECLIEVAHFYHRHNKPEESESYYKRALQTYETLDRADQRRLYELPRAYADLLKEQKRTTESDAIAKQYLHLYEPIAGEQIK
ncbi:MAG TPA: tetratricopeptide repeat protein [Oculatellaceae cyanobacterium]